MNVDTMPPPKLVAKLISDMCSSRDICFIDTTVLRELMDEGMAAVNAARGFVEYTEGYIRRCMDDYTIAFQNFRMRYYKNGDPQRVRMFKQALADGRVTGYPEKAGKYAVAEDIGSDIREHARRDMSNVRDTRDELKKQLVALLQDRL
jgi:hypothetical protein